MASFGTRAMGGGLAVNSYDPGILSSLDPHVSALHFRVSSFAYFPVPVPSSSSGSLSRFARSLMKSICSTL